MSDHILESSIEDLFPVTSAEESIISKDWAAGSSEQHKYTEFVISRKDGNLSAKYKEVKYPPALWKIVDELIVNALDHLIRQLGSKHPVTLLKVSIDKKGRIRVYNNGPGIKIIRHRKAEEMFKREVMWLPTLIFGTLFQGSNRYKSEDCIIGGTNGLGAKLANCFADEFNIETSDGDNYFLQQWLNSKQIEKEPIIKDLKSKHGLQADRTDQHTLISFVPAYTRLFGYAEFTDQVYETLSDLIRTRMYFAAAYARWSQPNVKTTIMFNDEPLAVNSIADIANVMFPGAPQFKTIVTPKPTQAKTKMHFKYQWEVCAVITPSSQYETAQLSNVNGVIVRDGKHYRHILNEITEGVKEKITKIFHDKDMKFSPSYVSGNIFLFLNTKIPNPSWTGQRKDVCDTAIGKFSQYIVDSKFTQAISEKIKDQVIDSVFNAKPENRPKKQSFEIDDYEPAINAGKPKKAHLCRLIPVEGKSAMTQVKMGISKHLGWENYGVFSLGGVIMNARKQCTVYERATGRFIKKTKKLTDNKFMNALYDVTGLRPEYLYDPDSPTYKKEKSELKYGYISMCVDQDLDGKGNILGLFLSLFELFWPNLIKQGFIEWFCTPIIRAYPTAGGDVCEFYNTQNYDAWVPTVSTSKYEIGWYKGLATHSRDETINMFKTFHQHLYTYTLDDRSKQLFEIYYGDDPSKRKIELAQPTKFPSAELIAQQEATMRISCSDHLEFETNLYQKDNIERKLDHVIDGQNQAGRKILDGLIKALKSGKKMRVAQLGGYVSEHENYHHGEQSLFDSITGRGFIAVGGKQIPFIYPHGNFGTRIGGGDDAGSARYIHATLIKKIIASMFPESDYGLLPFNFDEGKRSEPKYFVPVIPHVICESTELPGHGWQLKKWARDVFAVITNVRRLIKLGDNVELLKMPPTSYKGAPYEWKGEFKSVRGDMYSFGKYKLSDDGLTLTITELPLRVWTDPYVKMLKKRAVEHPEIIADVINKSDDLKVEIVITLKPGAAASLDRYADGWYADGIEEYFLLRDHMNSQLNFIGCNGEVLEYKDYETPMYEWFRVRKYHYKLRVDREEITQNMEIRRLENQIRYIESGFKMSKLKKAQMEEICAEAKFDKMFVSLITNPEFTPNDTLEYEILSSPKATFDYLLNLSDLKKSEEQLTKYKEKLAGRKQALDAFLLTRSKERFPGSTMFEQELIQLETAIREGQKSFWKYGDENKFNFQ